MDIYVHKGLGREVRQADAGTKVGDLRDGNASAHVWLENQDEPLDPEALIQEVAGDGAQVHVSTCRAVEVRVRYGGADKTKAFVPAVTIARVFEWACSKDGFGLSATEKAKHTLQVCGQTTQPDKSDHIGSYADDACQVCLDLAPKERFEG